MDIKKVSQLESLVPNAGGKNISPVQGGPSFQDMLQKLQHSDLAQKPTPGVASEGVKFSNHAVERMMSRGISFDKAALEKLNAAVSKAAAKGSKDTLVLMNDAALIVSVKNKTVVTVMDKEALKENVFTNIDSTVVM